MRSFPSSIADQFQLRLPTGMRDMIKKMAADNDRSMNAEIVYRLKKAYGAAINVAAEKEKDGAPA